MRNTTTPNAKKTTEDAFATWMRQVDACVFALTKGLSVYDLADYCFADAFEDGRKPSEVARAALRSDC